MDRYIRNLGAISNEEQQILKNSSVCIVGLGGLGGYALELLARLGIGSITGIDFDRFAISNLNRQLLSNDTTMGLRKAEAALQRIKSINPEVNFIPRKEKLTAGNARELLAGHSVILDALDNAGDRLLLGSECCALNIPLVHGAVDGWRGQAAVVYPGDDLLIKLFSNSKAAKQAPSVLSFTPAAVASLQVSLALRVLLKKDLPKANSLFLLDLANCTISEITI